MQTVNFDLGQLLRKVKAGHFLIPQFQRDFTWKEGQTRLLIDSIARNYPMGSLLVLGRNEEISFKSRKINISLSHEDNKQIEDEEKSDEPGSESYYVLDGQQRLTSITRVFLDAHPGRNYYFDLKQMHEVFHEEDPSWIISRTRGQKNPDRKDNNRLIRTDIALSQAKCDVFISEYVEDSGDFGNKKQEIREIAAKLKGIFETIRKYSIPLIVLDSSAPLESVCRVFETINSTGTRLTTFDLAVAHYFPEPDLKKLLDSSTERYPILDKDNYHIDGERILQTLSLYHLRKEEKFPEATRSVLLSLKPEFIESNWDKASKHFSEACEWIKQLGVTPKIQPSHGTLVSIVATLVCFPKKIDDAEFSNMLKKWYFCTMLAANSSPNNNYKIGNDFRQFCDFLDSQKKFPYPRVYFTADELIGIKHHTDSRYKAIQALMRTTIKDDLMTGNNLGKEEVEEHHIFPSSLKKSGIHKDKINSVINKIIISKTSNRKISDDNPEKYLIELVKQYTDQGNIGELNRRMKSCFIPYKGNDPEFKEKFSYENFEQFLQDRAVMIIERIKEVVGDAWKAPSDEEKEGNLEDDDVTIS